jgi:hypothetical protein
MEASGLYALAALPLQLRAHGTHRTGGWMGPRADLDSAAKKKTPISAGNWTAVIDPVA